MDAGKVFIALKSFALHHSFKRLAIITVKIMYIARGLNSAPQLKGPQSK